jgi:glycine cleavage system H protein
MNEKKFFSKKHEWVELNGDIGTVGITAHATEMLGDIVFVEVPESGKSVDKDGQAAVVESTKAASDVYSPISGEITEGNKSIVDSPESVNLDPEGASWFFKIKIKDKSELDTLMSKEEYDKFVAENPS